MTPVIRVDAVNKRFGAVTAVDGLTLDVRENECLALLGPSGCGKTTLLRMMAGLESPDSGRIFIDGVDVTATPPYARPVNMMFQSYALFPHMTVADNVGFGLKQEGLGGAVLTARVHEALAAVELQDLSARKPHELSGGQRQRVALARCLAKRPRVLLLDEPMAALDKHLRERTQLELMGLRKRLGISFVVVTHDQGEAMAIADRVVMMDAGRILQADAPRVMYERPANARVARFIGDINVWDATVKGPGCVNIAALHLEAKATVSQPIGAHVAVALRPERIAIDARPGAHGALAGTIAEAVYLGTATTYFVRVGNGAVVRVLAQNSEGAPVFTTGAEVHISWSPEALMVLAP